MEEAPLIQQNYCGYEHCQRPIETVPGHRTREYCNDACRQAARRLRKAREQRQEKADLGSFLRRVHSPRLRVILERVLRDQGEVALLNLVVAIEEERGHQTSDGMLQKRIDHLEAQLAEYRSLIDLDDRARITQQFMTIGEILGYPRLDKFGIGQGVENWKDYQSWTHEATLAEAILYGRALIDEEAAARERVESWSKLRQIQGQLAAAQAEIQKLQRELARHLPPPRVLLECNLRLWCTKVKISYQGETLAGTVLDAFICQGSCQQILKFIDIAQRCYFIGKHRRRRIGIIQRHLAEVEPYRGDPSLSIQSMDDQGYITFANGDKRWQDTDAIERFWARIVGKEGQQRVGGNADIAVLQQYLCTHPGACIPIQQGKDSYRLVLIDNDGLGITDSQRLVRLFEDDLEQAHQWVESNGCPIMFCNQSKHEFIEGRPEYIVFIILDFF